MEEGEFIRVLPIRVPGICPYLAVFARKSPLRRSLFDEFGVKGEGEIIEELSVRADPGKARKSLLIHIARN